MKSILFFVIPIFYISLFILSCNKSVDPIVQPEAPKDPRSYTWTIDTISHPSSYQTSMRSIWGSSAKDVYIVGHNDCGSRKMYHFDGNTWNVVPVGTYEGGTISEVGDFSRIIGFSSNNIWVAGDRIDYNPTPPPNFVFQSLLIQYDGKRWKEIVLDKTYGEDLDFIWGDRPDNIFTCGMGKTYWHYNGSKWKKDSLPIITDPKLFYSIYSLHSSPTGEIYAYLYSNDNSTGKDVYYFFINKNNKWTLQDSMVKDFNRLEKKWNTNGFWMSPEGKLYSVGDGILVWDGNNWNKIMDLSKVLITIGGYNENNLYAVGIYGTVFHYNGKDWFQFKQFENNNVMYVGIWTDGKEVFIVGYTLSNPTKTLVIHGK